MNGMREPAWSTQRPNPSEWFRFKKTSWRTWQNLWHTPSSFKQLESAISPACRIALLCQIYIRQGAPLDNCFGFIDGTVRPICRPNINQRVMYNGHKRVHGIKFQSVVVPNGLIANLSGPYEGKKHDRMMLNESGLLGDLELNANYMGQPLCLYGDPAYPLRRHLQAPYRNRHLTPAQQDFNTAICEVRESVEWLFGQIVEYF